MFETTFRLQKRKKTAARTAVSTPVRTERTMMRVSFSSQFILNLAQGSRPRLQGQGSKVRAPRSGLKVRRGGHPSPHSSSCRSGTRDRKEPRTRALKVRNQGLISFYPSLSQRSEVVSTAERARFRSLAPAAFSRDKAFLNSHGLLLLHSI